MLLCPPAPLEDRWERALAAALGRSVTPAALAVMVARQSARYRGEDAPLAHADGLAARALFWFARDLRKCALPVEELLAVDALPARPLRVLDLGAGLGATSLGMLRALRGRREVAHVTAVDVDPQALSLLRRVASEAAREGLLPSIPSLVTEVRDLSAPGWDAGLGAWDVVLVGLSLVEVTRALGDEDARGAALASLVDTCLSHVAPDGALVVIEPATRDESRCLLAARDLLVARGVTVFAPCPHARPCPMRARPTDWCHEDLADDALPAWLVPVARAAGLRYEGLTFSYLTLRRDDVTLASRAADARSRALRLLSAPRATKGKVEAIACGDVGASASTRIMELAREAKRHEGETLVDATRGDVLVVDDAALADGGGGTVRLSPGAWRRFGG